MQPQESPTLWAPVNMSSPYSNPFTLPLTFNIKFKCCSFQCSAQPSSCLLLCSAHFAPPSIPFMCFANSHPGAFFVLSLSYYCQLSKFLVFKEFSWISDFFIQEYEVFPCSQCLQSTFTVSGIEASGCPLPLTFADESEAAPAKMDVIIHSLTVLREDDVSYHVRAGSNHKMWTWDEITSSITKAAQC